MDPDAPTQYALRHLPSVDHVLRQAVVANLLDEFPRAEVLRAVRCVLDQRRAAIRDANVPVSVELPDLALAVRETLFQRQRPSLRRVINATGIVLHTGLGRAPLADEALEAVAAVAGGYCNLELDLVSGQRGDRHTHVRELLCELTGAEDALVVNNNAAATVLALAALAPGADVLVSRGELVEIGGSYRLPEIMAAAGCTLVEVGTTNRTRIADYERGLTDRTRVLLRVHTSNYRIVGFAEAATLADLVSLARRRPALPPLLVVDDLGSGLLLDGERADELPPAAATALAGWDEPSAPRSVAAGADVVLFSGDKLLGGPQAGLIVGRSAVLARLRAHPLMRAVRPDKMALAALDATLRLYRDPAALPRKLPVLRMLTAGVEALEALARDLERGLRAQLPAAHLECRLDTSFAGGGALPTLALPTWTVRLRQPTVPSQALAAALRQRDAPIVARLHDDALVLDARTLARDDVEAIVTAIGEAIQSAAD